MKYDTDPSSPSGGVVLPFSMFDTTRIMALIRAGRLEGLPPMKDPTDEALIANVCALGMPRWSAEQMRYHPGLRLQYYMVWLDVKEAARGNVEAQGRVDGIREAYVQMRKDELVADRPDMSVGMWER